MAKRAPTVDRACLVCDRITVVYLSELKWTPGKGTYCSRTCQYPPTSQRSQRPLRPAQLKCHGCECIFPFAGGKRFCTRACRKRFNTALYRQKHGRPSRARPPLHGPPRPPVLPHPSTKIGYGNCEDCGATFIQRPKLPGMPYYASRRYCSRACAGRADSRHQKHLRRAAVRQGRANQRSFTTHDVGERDGWRCHLCGKRVPNRPYASRPTDPTLDHLIPIADGGPHTLANVGLAHNLCNMRRNTGGTVQLRLVG